LSDGWRVSDKRPGWLKAVYRVLHDPVCDCVVLAPALREVHDHGLGNEHLDILVLGAAREAGPMAARALACLIALASTVVVALGDDAGLAIPREKLVLVAPSAEDPRVRAHLEVGGRAVIGAEGARVELRQGAQVELVSTAGAGPLAGAVAHCLAPGARTAAGEPL
jgi:hypothetical protein